MSHFDVINLPRRICLAMIGKNHHVHHRMLVGAGIMVTGMFIAQASHFFSFVLLKVTCDLVGYSFHGIGSVPLLEWLMSDDKGGPPPPAVEVIYAPRQDVRWG